MTSSELPMVVLKRISKPWWESDHFLHLCHGFSQTLFITSLLSNLPLSFMCASASYHTKPLKLYLYSWTATDINTKETN